MTELTIEDYIQRKLSLEEQDVALNLVRFLIENHLSFYKDGGAYWKDKLYYWVKYKDICVCYIAIKNPDEESNHWTVWSEDIGSEWMETDSVGDIKETAWKYVDHCNRCGSCGGGRRKVVFGKEFDDVCGCTFRIDNPKYEDLLFLKKMVEIRVKEIELLAAYKKNPCGVLSIPYWKNKSITIPANMRIVHDRDFSTSEYQEYKDEPYFRLFHSLEEIKTVAPDGIAIVTAKQEDIPHFVDVINQAYTDLSVTYEQLIGYTQSEVYHPELWVMAVNQADSSVVGCGIAELDRELNEGILEWIQVLPAYRGKKIGQLIVNELLKRMVGIAEFATVSGKVNNVTSPEMLYRKCGFVGEDVWHILTK